MKGSHRRLIIGVVVLLVVGVAGSVLFAQAMAGEGAGFQVMKALAFTGGGAVTVTPMESADDPQAQGAAGPSCGATGGSCLGEAGGASCSLAPAAATDAAATCTADAQGDCSACDQKETCPLHQATQPPAAATTN